MRRALMLGLVLALLSVAGVPRAMSADWRSFDPATFSERSMISVEGKELVYYQFASEEPLTFSVEGPTRVKILTRARIPNDREEFAYSVSVERDGVLERTESMESVPAANAFYIGFYDFRPGAIRRIYIDVPTGRHGYSLRAANGLPIDARLFRSTRTKPSRTSIAPDEYASVETLLYRDKELSYYVLTGDDPVVLEVVGPTSVKVNTRLLYDSTMLGEQTYVVGVREPGSPERLYKMDTEPSETVVCRDRGDVIPGALRHFMLEVGRGSHTYEFRLVDAVAGGLAIKFYIPRGDLSNAP